MNNKGKSISGRTWEVSPGDNYFTIMQKLEPGDELVFHEGEYYDVFRILRSGLPDKPIKIRGYGQGEKRPFFDFKLRTAPIEIYASNVVLDYMDFCTLREGNFVHIRGGGEERRSDNITIQNCVFRNSPSVVIDSNTENVKCDNLKILNNVFLDIDYTCIYIGNHAGLSPASNVLIEGNYIDVSRVNRTDIVGYGMELKLNTRSSIVRNNIVMNSQGPGIMVYGCYDGKLSDANIVEGNVVIGSRNSAGILAGGGPSILRNNIVLSCPGGGLHVYDYNNRGLMDNIQVLGNALILNNPAGIIFNGSNLAGDSLSIRDNLIVSKDDVPVFHGTIPNNPRWNVENNHVIKADEELEELTANIKKQKLSDIDSLKKVRPHLAALRDGSFDVNTVKNLIKKLLENLR